MAQERIRAGGELTLSHEVLEAAGVHPGDMAEVEVMGPHKIKITVVSDAVQPDE
jgi:Cu/Zn superoxide dismutase